MVSKRIAAFLFFAASAVLIWYGSQLNNIYAFIIGFFCSVPAAVLFVILLKEDISFRIWMIILIIILAVVAMFFFYLLSLQ